MTDMIFKLPEETANALREIAANEKTTVAALVNRLVETYIEQYRPVLENDPVYNLDWLIQGQFASGFSDTGRYADEIINGEREPTPIEPKKWPSVGLFNTGYNETGRNADEILRSDYDPE